MDNDTRTWLIWDGDCGFCAWTLDWLMARKGSDRVTPVAQQLCPNPPLTPELAARAQSGLLLIEPGKPIKFGADAALQSLAWTQGFWAVFAKCFLLPPFIFLARGAYAVIARNRGRISKRFFGGQACGINYRKPPQN